MTNNEIPDVMTKDTKSLGSVAITTHNGQRLSPKEDKFITLYIKYADPMQAAKEAGYSVRDTFKNKEHQWRKKGKELLEKDYIKHEISYRMDVFRSEKVADTQEILAYLTSVMRGEEKDQFGMDVSISDRTAAAKELSRRIHELESASNTEGAKEVHLVLERNF
jgi:phage terminase small subunit